MDCEKYLNQFSDCLFVSNYSKRTIDSYINIVKGFFEFVERHYMRVKTVDMITKDILSDYQSYLANYKTSKGTFLSSTTQVHTLAGLKRFFQFMNENDYIIQDLSKDIHLPRKEDSLVRNILTESEVRELLSILKTITPIQIRNRAIIELLYSCGIRTTELCNLKIHDINLKEQVVSVIKGKGNKSRLIPLGQYASEYIRLYIEKSRRFLLKGKKTDTGYLFLSSHGNPFNRSSLNTCVINSVMKRSGIDKHISAYSFRHSLATHLLENKVDIMYIAKLLGHASLNTTQRYTRVEISDLKRVHSLTHPREKGTEAT